MIPLIALLGVVRAEPLVISLLAAGGSKTQVVARLGAGASEALCRSLM